MVLVDTTEINSFAQNQQQSDSVQPVEPSITVSVSQLRDIITQAVKEAVAPLQERIEDLEARVDSQDEKISDLQRQQDNQTENSFIQLKLINQIRQDIHKEPQPLQKDRGEILRALIAANGGKMLAKGARQKMRLDEATFSRLVDTLDEYIEIKQLHSDKRKKLLILKSKIT
jgi:CHASE3 domain sensor protein